MNDIVRCVVCRTQIFRSRMLFCPDCDAGPFCERCNDEHLTFCEEKE